MESDMSNNYTEGYFEVEAGVAASVLTGKIGAEAHEPGEPATRIFDINDLVHVDCVWSLTGSMSRMICGTWQCDVYLESMGEGPEFEIEGCTMPLDPGGTGEYRCTIPIPAGKIQPAPDETDIPYKMTVSVTYKDPKGRPGPIAGFVELPLVQWYKDI
jgi:hypothetical protein